MRISQLQNDYLFTLQCTSAHFTGRGLGGSVCNSYATRPKLAAEACYSRLWRSPGSTSWGGLFLSSPVIHLLLPGTRKKYSRHISSSLLAATIEFSSYSLVWRYQFLTKLRGFCRLAGGLSVFNSLAWKPLGGSKVEQTKEQQLQKASFLTRNRSKKGSSCRKIFGLYNFLQVCCSALQVINLF